ncbi:1940_t:CDS:2 [Ambispora leptoticha]|uniref:1940_t:CDS:1 n=1 Tax=Ambispora leptoticha TaxID=144679 RepID=A0A9N9D4Z6_9GLOM|nr:1940_t:CDS:2 [Ambispora leptoticha]
MSAQTIPVTFSDIGKSANDLLSKDFPVGLKLEAKTNTNTGVTFTVNGHRDAKTGNIHGDLKTKYTYPKNGVTFTGSWTTSNHLNGQLELENNVAKGLKLDIVTQLQPAIGQRNAKAGVIFKQPGFHSKFYIDLFKGPIFYGDAVIGHEGFVLGGEGSYDVLDGKLTRFGVAAGYNAPEYSIALRTSNSLNSYTAAAYHRVQPDIEVGAKIHWDAATNNNSNNNVTLETGVKYSLDRDTFIKSRIDNFGRLGLSYTQNLRPGVKISMGGIVETSRLNENVHRFGISLNLES